MTGSSVSFVLASTSPRRIELLRQAGLVIEVQAPDADESPRRGEKPRDLVKRLSIAKAESVVERRGACATSEVVIAADTIVVAPDGKSILGKPRDQAEAARMLKSLAGKTHTVFTGYCLVIRQPGGVKPKRIQRVVQSRVKMRKLTPEAIRRYVESGEPMDKAGSYAAQGIGMALIEEIRGSYANVVGLPIAQVLQDLEKPLRLPLLSWMK